MKEFNVTMFCPDILEKNIISIYDQRGRFLNKIDKTTATTLIKSGYYCAITTEDLVLC